MRAAVHLLNIGFRDRFYLSEIRIIQKSHHQKNIIKTAPVVYYLMALVPVWLKFKSSFKLVFLKTNKTQIKTTLMAQWYNNIVL